MLCWIKREEKILEEIIKPKDKLIKDIKAEYKEDGTHTFINHLKQLEHEEREKEWDLEI